MISLSYKNLFHLTRNDVKPH